MNWILQRKLRALAAKANPRKDFEFALRKELCARMGPRGWYSSVALRYSSVTLAAAVVFGAGTGAYAYSSDSVLPDHPLYPLRQELERVEVVLHPAPEQRARVILKHAARRVHEMNALTTAKNPALLKHTEKFADTVDAALVISAELPTSSRERVDTEISTLEHAHVKLLVRERDAQNVSSTRASVERLIEKETKRMSERVLRMEAQRQKQFERQTKRADALNKRLELRLDRDRLRAVSPSSTVRASETDERVRLNVDLEEGEDDSVQAPAVSGTRSFLRRPPFAPLPRPRLPRNE